MSPHRSIVAPLAGMVMAVLAAAPAAMTARAEDPAPVAGSAVRAAPGRASATLPRPLRGEEQSLLAIERDCQRQVAELVRLMNATSDVARRNELARSVESLKLGLQVQLLQTRAVFARQRGDLVTARALDETIARLTKPAPRPQAPNRLQHPDKTVTEEGGRP